MFWVYVIENQFNKIYIGQTKDLTKRLNRHNRLLPNSRKSYTYKNKGAWRLIYKEEYFSRKETLEREKFLKSHKGRDWLRKKVLKEKI